MTIFGAMVTDTNVEEAVITTLNGWLPTYVQEVARQDGGGSVAYPQSFEVVRAAVTSWPEQKLPAIVVQVNGTLATERKGFKYRAVYGGAVGAIVAGQTRQNTRRLAGVYSLAIAAALCQHADLGGIADGVEWHDTDYTLIDENRSRTIMAAIVSVSIAIPNVMDVSGGPVGAPPTVPTTYPDWGEAATVEIDVPIATTGTP